MSLPSKEAATDDTLDPTSMPASKTAPVSREKTQEDASTVVDGSMELHGHSYDRGKDKEQRLRMLDDLQVLKSLTDGVDSGEELAKKIEAPSSLPELDVAQSGAPVNQIEVPESPPSRDNLGSVEFSERGRMRSSNHRNRNHEILAEATPVPSLTADLVEDPTLAHATPLSTKPNRSDEEEVRRRRRKRRFVIFMAVGALLLGIVVGLSARLIPKDDASDSAPEDPPQDPGLASPPPSAAPTQDISEIWDRMTHFSYNVAVWGTAYTCLHATSPVINLSCRGSDTEVAIQVFDSFGASCRRLGTNLVQCNAERAVIDLLEGVVLFACGAANERSIEATSEVMPSQASECQHISSTSGFSEVLGGVAVAYTNLGRFCIGADSAATADDVQGGALVLETPNSCVEGNETVVEIDTDGSVSPQLYCFRSSECETTQTCRPGEECTGESHCEIEIPNTVVESSADTLSTSDCVLHEAPAAEQLWSLVEEILDHRGRFLQSFLYDRTR